MERWNETALAFAHDDYERILNHPFVQELISGKLPQEKFVFYLAQDKIYLSEFAKAMKLLAQKMTDEKSKALFIQFANETLQTEQALQEQLSQHFNVQNEIKRSPACDQYINRMFTLLEHKDNGVTLSSFLPCFWVYNLVGLYIHNRCQLTKNPYKEWIMTYADTAYQKEVETLIELCNLYATNGTEAMREEMTQTFAQSVRMEHRFWDDAYFQRLIN